MKKLKAAVSGFRHEHIVSIVKKLKAHPEIEITACSEEEPGKCASIIDACGLEITHGNLESMLEEAEFDILAIADVYTSRGPQAVKALSAGRHVLSDKPLCTGSGEIASIKKLSREKNLSVMAALTLRYNPVLQKARKLLSEGIIGEPTNLIITGQHGLKFRAGRPGWYFEKGKHGGTVNDLMVHGIDAAPWLTGRKLSSVLSALTGHFQPGGAPFFQDIAKAFFLLENGGGVFIDSSYMAPDGHPAGWEFRIWGTGGSMDFSTSGDIIVRRHNEKERKISPELLNPADFVEDLVREIKRTPGYEPVLTSEECILSTEIAAATQEAADNKLFGVPAGR